MSTKYYHLDSDGEYTNLQLYALRQARIYWRDIERDYRELGDDAPYLRERCVFAIAAMGLSLSQLLGQNNPTPTPRVPSPTKLLEQIVQEHRLDADLIPQFERFIYFYDGSRHFGRTPEGNAYQKIDQLSYDAARECFQFGLELWRVLLRAYGKMPGVDFVQLDIDELENDPEEYW